MKSSFTFAKSRLVSMKSRLVSMKSRIVLQNQNLLICFQKLNIFIKSAKKHIVIPMGHRINILKNDEFKQSRSALMAKRRQLVSKGKGNRPYATRALTESEEDKLFEEGFFGNQEPRALQRAMWWFLSLHFGFRARDENRKLCWGDVILSEDPDSGVEMLCWQVERGSKTQQGQEFLHQCAFNPTLHATNQDWCPVKYYKSFRDHRPPEINRVESPFFLAVKTKRSPNNPVWYMKYLLGKNELGKLLGEVAKIANLGGPHKVTNHSVHKTSISRLLDTNCPEFYVSQLSGHKSWQSLNSYKTASLQHQRTMSHILSRESSSSSIVQMAPAAPSPSESSSGVTAKSLFSGASIGSISGCTFNFVCGPQESPPAPAPRKRRCIIESDSDED